jgi:hypothetical protein
VALLIVVLALALGADGSGAVSTPDDAPTSLTITFWQDEQASAPTRRWTLRCVPARGTLPTRRTACHRLAGMTRAAFAPVPRTAICTDIYGGPQKAVVKGTLAGSRIWASFRRRNGCEIDRWQRFSPWLLPPGGATR